MNEVRPRTKPSSRGSVTRRRADPAITRAPFISKSKFLWGLQCPKLLWHAYNAKHLIPEPDTQQQAVFDQGHAVGELARQLFSDGIEIGKGMDDFDGILAASKMAVRQCRPLYEAAFAFNGGYARADILNPVDNDQWDLIEVKSTTSVKDIHLHDLAFQTYLFNGAGLKIRRCILAHINPNFIRHGAIDSREFFAQEDVTSQVAELSRSIEAKLEAMSGTIRQPQHPDIQIGPHCDKPYRCPLHDRCWRILPEANVTQLYRAGAKGFGLLRDGIADLKDIPDDFALTGNQEIQRRAAKTGQPHVDKPALAAFLNQFRYPISFLDFETLATAIPLFDGVKPFQQVPFQFSLHVVPSPNGKLAHDQFLAAGAADPRPEFMRRLRDALAERGSVVAFNAQFELARLEESCDAMPQFRPWLKNVESRAVDLLPPFRGFRYYHPKQNGSASMKAVLPALTGKGYDDLAIQEGGAASLEFLRVTFGDVTEEERRRVRRQLEEYCGRDTEGMVWIVGALGKLVGV